MVFLEPIHFADLLRAACRALDDGDCNFIGFLILSFDFLNFIL